MLCTTLVADRWNREPRRGTGFTLIELVIVIILVGVLATVAARMLSSTLDTARFEHTKQEMDQLAMAILGDPDLRAGGVRVDFGYLGDIGALPPNLDALVQNPGGMATWRGPYLVTGGDTRDFRNDAWGVPYSYSGDILITSTGSGFDIEKELAGAAAELLANHVEGYVVDADNSVPASQQASMQITLCYPDGAGGKTTVGLNPTGDGSFAFANIPVGYHTMRFVYVPDSDTLIRAVAVLPGQIARVAVVFPTDIWGL